MSEFKISQLFEVGERGETGLSLMDTIAVVFGVDEVKAQKLALDPEIRKAHAEGRTRGVAQVMEGMGVAASQLLPEGYFGTSPTLKPEPYDPAPALAGRT